MRFVLLLPCALFFVGCQTSKKENELPQKFVVPQVKVVSPPGTVISGEVPCVLCGKPVKDHYFVRKANREVILWGPEH